MEQTREELVEVLNYLREQQKKVREKIDAFDHEERLECPDCSHVGVYDMRFLVWNMNCKKCLSKITTEDRVKKTKFKLSDFR